ncbi:MAG: phycobiliprotein lyase [Leptolyngbya sp. SIO1D8]|nr:phycobiliprotein lyase [Leptolyngbya sp. SIO1D8]
MNIQEFVEQSIGQWRSQRSAHHLAFSHFEAIESVIDIETLSCEDASVIELCKAYGFDIDQAVSPFKMSWEGYTDWDEGEKALEGSCVLVPIPDPKQINCGKLLRDQGYAETMAAAGEYHITEDGTFVLLTHYDRAAAEEKIWFVNPNVRCRVSLIKTSAGSGVVTASFSSEIRQS